MSEPRDATGGVASSSEEQRRRNYRAVSVGHLAIDVFNSMGPVLLAHLRVVMGLSTAQVGLAVGVYQLLAGATQPLFGWLVDRGGSRRLGPGSVAWVIVLVAASSVLAPAIGFWPFLLLFSAAAVGSGAFHPQGTMHAGIAVAGRSSTTTAIFFFCGQVGLSLGPLLAGVLIDRHGLWGIGGLALVALPVPLWMAVLMRRRIEPVPQSPIQSSDAAGATAEALALEGEEPAKSRPLLRHPRLVVTQLAAVFALRAWVFIGTASFLPLLFQAGGASAARQGLLTGAFWLGGGVTGVLAGALADRAGRRLVAAVSTAVGSLMLPLLPDAAGSWALLLVFSCGGLLGAQHSVLMVLAQELLPVRRGLASGYALGFLFSCGALASWGIGLLAESFPLALVIRWGVFPGLMAAVLMMLLPGRQNDRLDSARAVAA